MSYNSKYKGSEVEELLDSIGNKVDKVEGKQLSTEDFTTILKEKLDGLSNYDDTEINQAVETLRGDFDTLVSGDTTAAIKTFNEIIDFLDGLEDTEDLASIIASIEQQIAAKGTVTSITAGDGLTGGTITENGTISLEELSDSSKSMTIFGVNSFTSGLLAINPDLPVNTITVSLKGTPYITLIDKYGRVNALGQDGDSYATLIALDVATTLKAGLMSVADKLMLNSLREDKQDTLVSGTNIKTINGESILGSGNIVIEGGSGSTSSGGSGAYAEVNHGTSDTTFTLTSNTFHVWDEVATLDLSFGEETSGVANEYLFQFTSGATATTLTLPDDIKWANDSAPTIAENMIYQISVLKGLASVLEFSNSVEILENMAVVGGNIITFAYPVASDLTISYMGRAAGASGAPTNLTTTISAGELSVTPGGSVFSINSITPESDDKYTYSFQQS